MTAIFVEAGCSFCCNNAQAACHSIPAVAIQSERGKHPTRRGNILNSSHGRTRSKDRLLVGIMWHQAVQNHSLLKQV